MKILNKTKNFLFNEKQNIKNKDIADENYQCMKNLNIELLKEGIAFKDENFEFFIGEKDRENLKYEIVKRNFKINCLEKLNNVYEKDLQVKEAQINKLKKEIEGIKMSNK